MGKTSATVKNRYANKVYDRIVVLVPKGRKTVIQAFAEGQGKSTNVFINEAIDEKMKRTEPSTEK